MTGLPFVCYIILWSIICYFYRFPVLNRYKAHNNPLSLFSIVYLENIKNTDYKGSLFS